MHHLIAWSLNICTLPSSALGVSSTAALAMAVLQEGGVATLSRTRSKPTMVRSDVKRSWAMDHYIPHGASVRMVERASRGVI